jgi:hypothetical protein
MGTHEWKGMKPDGDRPLTGLATRNEGDHPHHALAAGTDEGVDLVHPRAASSAASSTILAPRLAALPRTALHLPPSSPGTGNSVRSDPLNRFEFRICP